MYILKISYAFRIFIIKSQRHTALFCPVPSLNFELVVCAVISRLVTKPATWQLKWRTYYYLHKGLLLEWILQNMVRHFVTHKQLQADKRHPF